MPLQLVDAAHRTLVDPPDEQDKQDAEEDGQCRVDALAEGQRVIHPVDEDRHCQDAHLGDVGAVAKVALAVEIAHGTGDGKVGGHGSHASHDAGERPVLALQQVQDVLGPGKAQTDARGIDDAGNIMCMYHMLKDKEQAAVAEEVRKLLK